MKYMMLVKLNRKSPDGRNYEAGMPPDAKLGAAMEKLMEELTASGAMVETGGLLPLANGAQITAGGGRLTVTDGPFIESKEVVGGYAILRAKS
ncbi:MAG TPA: YciI family protein [Dongiaceae bacterium]|nr:YciI family protein [Dongiaceae bacterium]